MLPPLLVGLVLGVLVALDAGLRRAGAYGWTSRTWPAGWRKLPPHRRNPSPYRDGEQGEWVLVVGAGIPRGISVFFPPMLGVTSLWTVATALALGDLPDVVRGTRSLVFVLASLSLCVIRALACSVTLLAACEGRRRLFFLASGLALGLDAALARFPLSCSDVRADDVHMALAGGAVQAGLALAFAFSVWSRRGLVASARPSAPPGAPGASLGDGDDLAEGS